MTEPRSNSGVRNLRAMFESGADSQAPDNPRGRSPGDVRPENTNGSTSPRPLSKVRANFVAVEKGGQIGLQSPGGGEGGLHKLHPLPSRQGSITEAASTTVAPFTSSGPAIADEWKAAELPITPAIRALSANRGIEEKKSIIESVQSSRKINATASPTESKPVPPEQTSAAVRTPATAASQKSTQSKAYGDTVDVKNGGSATRNIVAKGVSETAAADGKAQKTPVAKESQSQKSEVKATRGQAISNTGSQTPLHSKTTEVTKGRPAQKSPSKASAISPTKSSLTKSHVSSPARPAGSRENKTTASRSSPSKPKVPLSSVPKKASPPREKIRPKSPTRPVKLPASATAPTASFAAKVGGEIASQPVVRKAVPSSRSSTDLRQKPSRHSLPHRGKVENDRPRSRVSSGSIPTQAPDEGFLARMMRPTASSLSKTHNKLEIKHPPPRRAPTVKRTRKSGGSEESRQSEENSQPAETEEAASANEPLESNVLPVVEESGQNSEIMS